MVRPLQAIDLGAALQRAKKKVLLIDLDGQANLTESLGLSIETEENVYTALKGETDLPLVELPNGMKVAPASIDLSAAEMELLNEPGRELILSGLINKITQKQKFDYILIDCPPSLGLLTLNALTAADRLIIPVQAQFLAARGMGKLKSVVEKVKERINPRLEIGGIVLTQYNGHKTLNKSVEETVREAFKAKVFKTMIRENIALAEAPAKKKTIFEAAASSNGAKDYEALAKEVAKMK